MIRLFHFIFNCAFLLIDPNRGLVSLPVNVVDPNALISQNPCKRGKESQLSVKGRSGLPPNLTEDFSSRGTEVNWVDPVATVNEAPSQEIIPKIEAKPRLEPAQSWIFNEKGQVMLIGYNTQENASQRSPLADKGCPVGGIQP